MKDIPANSYMLVEDFFNLQRNTEYNPTLLKEDLVTKAKAVIFGQLVEIKDV